MHCWRVRPTDKLVWEEAWPPSLEDPRFIAEMAIKEHRRTVSGYRGYPGVDERMWREALRPKHVAISLTGEPTLYSLIGDLIKEFHRRGLTTFLVTRGIRPDVLANLDEEPTQLYISIEAFNEGSYAEFNRPFFPNLWKLTLETLELLPSFTCPTVVRVTLVKSFNMNQRALENIARILKRAMPTFIEVKAYMHVGGSITRLKREDMPRHTEVRSYAEKLAEALGYNVVSESRPSRVVLLSTLDKPVIRYGNPPISWHDPDPGDEFSGEYGSEASQYI